MHMKEVAILYQTTDDDCCAQTISPIAVIDGSLIDSTEQYIETACPSKH